MDLEKMPHGGAASPCSICLDLVVDRGERSIARLQCGHEFHLDCIGSAFNAKGAMQCPNCRKVEKGRWLYANGHRSSSDFDLDSWVTGDMYDFGNSELPFEIQWCPFSGFTRYAAVFEESESDPGTYHPVGDHSTASPHAHVCPYIAVNGVLHPMHGPSTSNSDTESASYHRHPTGMETQPTDINLSLFHGSEPRHDREQQFLSSIPLSGAADHSTPPFGAELPRYDSTQQRVRPIVARPQPLFQRHASRAGSNLVPPMGSAALGEARGHAHSSRSQVYHPFVPSSMQQTVPVPPTTRRVRPRALTITSFIAASSSSELAGSHHGYSVSGAGVRNLPDGEGIPRHVDRSYGWGRESFTPLPWIPVEGESRWWGPFSPNPNQTHRPGSFPWRQHTERSSLSRMDTNGYHQRMPPRMPPYL